MKYKTLMISILLFVYTTVCGQLIKPLNDNDALIPKEELKYITRVFLDYQSIIQLRIKDLEKIGVLERIIKDKEELLKLRDEDIQMLKQQIEDINPAWYNKFSYGFAVGVIGTVVAIFLVR